jgi:DNA adenine methylase
MKPERPILRYHGGKWLLAPWIISHFPAHKVYVESFGGAASVLLQKKRSYAEVYNDLDGEVVSLFRMVRERGEELKRLLELTPFARADYLEAWDPSADPLEQARRTIIRSFMGFGSAAVTKMRAPTHPGRGGLPQTGFRANSNRSGTTPAHDWKNYPDCLAAIIDRLRGVVIENRPALEVIQQHDAPHTLHYVDPPYVLSTRDAGGDYRHEMTDDDHGALADVLKSVVGMVVLSGYPSALYDGLYAGWERVQRAAHGDGAVDRTEVLWINAAATSHPSRNVLFGSEARAS